MAPRRNTFSRNETLLLSSNRSQRSDYCVIFRGKHRLLMIVMIVLIVCAPIAYTLTSIIFHFYDPFKSDQKPVNGVFKFTTNSKNVSLHCPERRIVGYYTEWEAPEITESQLQKLTHVIFLFATIDMDATVKFASTNSEERFLVMKKKAREVNKDLKVMISVGGWKDSFLFSPLVADLTKRKKLINSIAYFVTLHQIDGVEVFWIYSSRKDKENYLTFLRELHQMLKSIQFVTSRTQHYSLSVVSSPFPPILQNKYHWKELMEEIDFINVLSYDYFHPNGIEKNKIIGPIAPVYGGKRGNVYDTMRYLTCETRNPQKLNLAVAFYGTYWNNVSIPFSTDDIWMKDELNREEHRVRWRNLKTELEKWQNIETKFHEKSKSSYIWIPESKIFMALETERSLKEKMTFANQRGIGGITIWSIDQDDDENTLLNVVITEKKCSYGREFKNTCY
ncbi:unnamed protein product [Caenorhabditis brenneri]